jgi:hypothetical protein
MNEAEANTKPETVMADHGDDQGGADESESMLAKLFGIQPSPPPKAQEITTGQHWLESSDPSVMLMFLQSRVTHRKPLVFAVACCRRLWRMIDDIRIKKVIELAELAADGHVDNAMAGLVETIDSENRVSTCWEAVIGLTRTGDPATPANLVAKYVPLAMCKPDVPVYEPESRDVIDSEREIQVAFIRDIFGNPFRSVTSQASWLTWNSGAIPRAANAAYEERVLPSGHLDNRRLAVLGDMLEEAGCTDAEILGHLREPGAVHVRGCWCVDLLMDKE